MPVELPVSLLPGVQDEWDSQTLGICVLCRGNVAVEGIKDGNHFPLLEISLQLRRSRTGRGHHRSPPAGKGICGPSPPEAHRFLHRGRWQFRHKPDTCGQFLKLEMRPQEDHTLVRAQIPGILAHVHTGLT